MDSVAGRVDVLGRRVGSREGINPLEFRKIGRYGEMGGKYPLELGRYEANGCNLRDISTRLPGRRMGMGNGREISPRVGR
ncbi:hypothetical protein D3C73_1174430 [compost metagenome]